MKICAISDLHGFLPELKPCDLVIICGDSVPLEFQMSSRRTKKWYTNTFAEWANNLSCEKVIFIAGNHDMYLEFHTELYEKSFSKNNKITYLIPNMIIMDIKFTELHAVKYLEIGHLCFLMIY